MKSMQMLSLAVIAVAVSPQAHVSAFSTQQMHNRRASASTSTAATTLQATPQDTEESWMDFLKFNDQTPSFDVIEKTKEYTSTPGYRSFSLKDIPTDYYDRNYIFRGPIVGPISREDLVATNTGFGIQNTFPDLNIEHFGFTVDPENPFRVLFFQRWTATNSGVLDILGLKFPATNKVSKSPAFPFSITWTPKGKIIYENLGGAVDRFEGNTKGKVAVFGLFETAGVSLDSAVGSPLVIAQKLGRFLNLPLQTYSREENIPSWWGDSARAAEKNDA